MHLDDEREDKAVYALLRHLDHPAPPLDAQTIAARARRRRFAPARRAAGIILTLGVAGAAYAAPGSPLPAWVKSATDWIAGGPERPTETGVSGLAIAPGRALVIRFRSPQDAGRVMVSLTDGAEVRVRAPIGAATFTSDVDQLVIDNRGPAATFAIEIPRSAPRVEIRVGDKPIYLKEGSRITTGQ